MSNYALIFPGQGSQSIGMLSELSTEYKTVEATFAAASEVLGFDLWALVQSGSAEELNKTWNTQPALLAASYAIFQIWQQKVIQKPLFCAGHSLGEYSALTCAGVIDFKAAIRLVALRGRLMQEAVPEGIGAMFAIIGLDNERILEACTQAQKELNQVVAAVNFNSPGQVVIAGQKEAVDRAGVLCKEFGAKRALPLPVSVPSHCALMKPAADKLAQALQDIEFKTPQIPVINNVNVRTETDGEQIKNALIAQLYSPVRWTEIIEFMAQQGAKTVIEIGAGKVLTGLAKRIVPSLNAFAVNDITGLNTAIEDMK